MPFWHGDGPGRPLELGRAVGETTRTLREMPHDAALARLRDVHHLDERAAVNLLAYIDDQAAEGAVPDDRTIVVERFRDEIGDWRVCVLSPFGARVHAPWAMVLQARLAERWGAPVELMWSDDGIVIRLPEAYDELPLEELLVDPEDVDEAIVTHLPGTALFASRFRECAARALLLPRRRPDRRTPLWQQRQRAADLLAVASRHPRFPILYETTREILTDVFDVPALRELLGDLRSRRVRAVPVDTPKASPFAQSLLFGWIAVYMYEGDAPLAERRAAALALDRDLLAELLGADELRDLLDAEVLDEVERSLQHLDGRVPARDADELHDVVRTLGPLTVDELARRSDPGGEASRVVRAARARAEEAGDDATSSPPPVGQRIDSESPSDQERDGSPPSPPVGQRIDSESPSGPQRIDSESPSQAPPSGDGASQEWPDAGPEPEPEEPVWPPPERDEAAVRATVEGWVDDLVSARRAIRVGVAGEEQVAAAEDAARLRDALGCAVPVGLPSAFTDPVDRPLHDLVARHARTHGPFLARDVARRLAVDEPRVVAALADLSSEGRVVQGEFRPGGVEREWCDNEVLRRIRRRSLAALRREVEPVEADALARFLPRWQGVGLPRRGVDGLVEALGVLQGAPVPASVLESDVLPARMQQYRPADLDALAAAGEVVWVGAGAIGSGDGRVRLVFRDELGLLVPDARRGRGPRGPGARRAPHAPGRRAGRRSGPTSSGRWPTPTWSGTTPPCWPSSGTWCGRARSPTTPSPRCGPSSPGVRGGAPRRAGVGAAARGSGGSTAWALRPPPVAGRWSPPSESRCPRPARPPWPAPASCWSATGCSPGRRRWPRASRGASPACTPSCGPWRTRARCAGATSSPAWGRPSSRCPAPSTGSGPSATPADRRRPVRAPRPEDADPAGGPGPGTDLPAGWDPVPAEDRGWTADDPYPGIDAWDDEGRPRRRPRPGPGAARAGRHRPGPALRCGAGLARLRRPAGPGRRCPRRAGRRPPSRLPRAGWAQRRPVPGRGRPGRRRRAAAADRRRPRGPGRRSLGRRPGRVGALRASTIPGDHQGRRGAGPRVACRRPVAGGRLHRLLPGPGPPVPLSAGAHSTRTGAHSSSSRPVWSQRSSSSFQASLRASTVSRQPSAASRVG